MALRYHKSGFAQVPLLDNFRNKPVKRQWAVALFNFSSTLRQKSELKIGLENIYMYILLYHSQSLLP